MSPSLLFLSRNAGGNVDVLPTIRLHFSGVTGEGS